MSVTPRDKQTIPGEIVLDSTCELGELKESLVERPVGENNRRDDFRKDDSLLLVRKCRCCYCASVGAADQRRGDCSFSSMNRSFAESSPHHAPHPFVSGRALREWGPGGVSSRCESLIQ